jgi:hypothetical protein
VSLIHPGVTGRKAMTLESAETLGHPPPTNGPPLLAYSIAEFCRLHSITRPLFCKLQREGNAPRVMMVGQRKLISAEAAAEWRRAQEQDAKPRPQRFKKD